MDKNLSDWREEGKHLPEFLRDFHDQKDFFKFLHDTMMIEKNGLTKNINVEQGHAYLIDCFLWKLAKHGYTIQRSRAKQNFENLNEAISKNNEMRNQKFNNILLNMNKNNDE